MMKLPNRDILLVLGLILLLAVITAAAAIQRVQEQAPPPLSSTSNAPEGALAFRLWLEAIGFEVIDEVVDFFSLPEEISLAFILEPSDQIAPEEWEMIDRWVKDGGTLILSGNNLASHTAIGHYEFRLIYLFEAPELITMQTPMLASPPITISVPAKPTAYLESSRDDFVTLLAVEDRPVLVYFDLEEGRVILGTSPSIFSNIGLKEPGNPELALNLVNAIRSPGKLWFDEWHHGIRNWSNEVIGPQDWLRYTPAGRSLLFAALVVFMALIFQGKAFGSPVPLPRQVSRRAPMEYIASLANLSRRAGHRDAILGQLHKQIKLHLGGRYRIPSSLQDELFVEELVKVRPDLDSQSLIDLLRRLRQTAVDEKEMVQLTREASDWLD